MDPITMIRMALSLACAFGGPYAAAAILPLVNVPLWISSFLPLFIMIITNPHLESIHQNNKKSKQGQKRSAKAAFWLYYFMLGVVIFFGAKATCAVAG